MKELLNIKDLHITFKGSKAPSFAVRGVNLSLQEQEIVGIVGESGSGKSATVRSILQLLPLENSQILGEIVYNGENLLKIPSKQIRKIRGAKISMIFQDPMASLNPTLKIGYQILEAYRIHFPHISRQEAINKVLSLLELVKIPDPKIRFFDYPHNLSGGMRQRIMIAMALICHPDILLADESTTALDVTIQAQILHLIKELQKEFKMSILFITHDLRVASEFCDRILVMYAGKIVEEGTTQNLFEHPKHPYTQLLLQALPQLEGEKKPLIPIQGSPPILKEEPKSCPFAPRCPYKQSRCLEEEPPLLKTKNLEHQTACFFWETL